MVDIKVENVTASGTWQRWEGQTIADGIHLIQYISGSDRTAVFLAEHGEGTPIRAAVKLMFADPKTAEIQLSHWTLAAKLSHPNLLRTLLCGRHRQENNEFLFVVTEYAEENLAQVLPQRSLTQDELRQLLFPTLSALSYLHEKGLVHSSLKPSNIFAVDDQLKLSTDNVRPASEGQASALPSIISGLPETTNGVSSVQAETWSLGALVVEALTQRRPGEKPGEAVVPPSLPRPFYEIAHNCLQEGPRTRWTIEDIKAALEGKQVPPKILTKAVETPSQPLRSGPSLFGPAPQRPMGQWASKWPFAVSGLVIVMAVGLTLSRSRTQSQPSAAPATVENQTPTQPILTVPSRPPVTAAKPSGPTPAPAVDNSTRKADQHGVVHEVVPDVLPSARNSIRGRVRVQVRVHVDRSGKVTRAEVASSGNSRYFSRLSLETAKEWTFVPIRSGASREWMLGFEYRRSGTHVSAKHVRG